MSGGIVPVLWSIQGAKLSAFLNPNHRKGASRWTYLSSFGLTREDDRALADTLGQRAMNNLPGVEQPRPTGPNRVEFRCTVRASDGHDMPLRTVWEVGGTDSETTMRLLTAIPLTP